MNKDSHKWGTLLGLFTGARVNEISQLHIADIRQEDDIWIIHFTDESDEGERKRIKADASKRKVPIHSRLIELGFLDFVASRKDKHERLFFDFNYTAKAGYGCALSRWTNETFFVKLEVKSKQHVFHSFRHTMNERLLHAYVPDPIAKCVIGHAQSGVTQEVYNSNGYTLRHLKEAIEKFEV